MSEVEHNTALKRIEFLNANNTVQRLNIEMLEAIMNGHANFQDNQ